MTIQALGAGASNLLSSNPCDKSWADLAANPILYPLGKSSPIFPHRCEPW